MTDIDVIHAAALERVEAKNSGEQWFDSLSAYQQKQYLSLHPDSKYAHKGVKTKAEKVDHHREKMAHHQVLMNHTENRIHKDLKKQGIDIVTGWHGNDQDAKAKHGAYVDAFQKHPLYNKWLGHEDKEMYHRQQLRKHSPLLHRILDRFLGR